MTAITDIDVTESSPNPGLKEFYVQTRNTVDATDTIAITLADYGVHEDGFLAILGWKHTTDNSVVVPEDPTVAVASGVLTITVPSGTDDDMRVYKVTGRAIANDVD